MSLHAEQGLALAGGNRRGWVLLLAGVVALGGCVSSGTFEATVKEREDALAVAAATAAERDALSTQRDALAAERNALANERSALLMQREELQLLVQQTEAQKALVAREAEVAKAEVVRQQSVFQNLQQTFAKEQQQNQVRVELMQSGIKVNLDNDILFPSGSASLNASGIDVLKRAATELKATTYQLLIAGYTDNVKISDKLQERYPSNWELAGARAASVVRLLEAEGVARAQMLSISMADNNPVASNETAAGRKSNRRIEIILRPEPIQMR